MGGASSDLGDRMPPSEGKKLGDAESQRGDNNACGDKSARGDVGMPLGGGGDLSGREDDVRSILTGGGGEADGGDSDGGESGTNG